MRQRTPAVVSIKLANIQSQPLLFIFNQKLLEKDCVEWVQVNQKHVFGCQIVKSLLIPLPGYILLKFHFMLKSEPELTDSHLTKFHFQPNANYKYP